MKKILLILSLHRNSQESVDEAIKLAKERDAELLIFFVLDNEYAESMVHKLADEGWIGGKPSEEFHLALLKEYKIQSEERIRETKERAQAKGIKVRSITKSGILLDETLSLATIEEPDVIVISRRKRSNLSRFIFGSLAKALKQHVNCEVKVIDAE